MKIVIDTVACTVSVASVSRSVVFPNGYAALNTITYDTETADGLGNTFGKFTMGGILATSLILWKSAEPTIGEMWERIKIKRSETNAGGVNVGGHWYHTDLETLAQYSIMYAAIAVNSLPGSYIFAANWKTMDGIFQPMTVNLLRVIVGTGIRNATLNFSTAERHKAAMTAKIDHYLYDYSTGWTKVHT
jgi:hypothetical protein